MKKILAFLMALVMLCTIGATAAFAADPSPSGGGTTPAVVPTKPEKEDTYEYGYEPYGDGHLLEEVQAGTEARREAWKEAMAKRKEAIEKTYDAIIVDPLGIFIKGVNIRNAKNPDGELIITPIADILAGKAGPEVDAELATRYYNELKNAADPSALIPELGQGFACRDFFDVTLVGAAGLLLTLPGLRLQFTMDLNLAPDEALHFYQANTARTGWEKATSCVNNGDGTATMRMSHLCPAAILTKATSHVESPRTADVSANVLWALAAICGLGAVVTLAVARKRSKAN